MSLIFELIEFMGSRKKFWLIPIMILFTAVGGLLILSQGSVVAPFIYALF